MFAKGGPSGPEMMITAAMKALGLEPAVVSKLANDLQGAISTMLQQNAAIIQQNRLIMAHLGIVDPTAPADQQAAISLAIQERDADDHGNDGDGNGINRKPVN